MINQIADQMVPASGELSFEDFRQQLRSDYNCEKLLHLFRQFALLNISTDLQEAYWDFVELFN